MARDALTGLHLDVYDNGHGPWSPEHGELDIPAAWEFLPAGDAFLTRAVKTAGTYWVAWRPRGRNRPHRRRLGLWAPAATIAQVRSTAEENAAGRARSRERGARQRARAEERYRDELTQAVLTYLDFAPGHAELAATIARSASARAAAVGSGRVGRTRKLALEERAALAARAWIRHRLTDYEDRLDTAYGEDFLFDELEYRSIKGDAHEAVDKFLDAHRREGQ